jgi:hypothetical protein
MEVDASSAVQDLSKRFNAEPTADQQQVTYVADAAFWKSTVHPANERWRLHCSSARSWKAFTKDDLFGESNECFHSMVKPFRKLADIQIRTVATVKHFDAVFRKCIDKGTDEHKSKEGKQMRKLALRLAKSDPIIMFSPDNWRGGNLMQNDASAAWLAAYHLFGAPWRQGTTRLRILPPKPPLRTLLPLPHPPKAKGHLQVLFGSKHLSRKPPL